MAGDRWYDFRELGAYLGNVGLMKIHQPTCVPLEVEPGQVALTASLNGYPHTYTYLGPTSDGRHQFRVYMVHPSYIGNSTEEFVLLPEVPINDIHMQLYLE